MGTALADVLYAMRRFSRAPGFTAVAILSLALGIGANTTLFLLVNAALLRLIPVEHPGELVWFGVRPELHGRTLNFPFYESIKDDARFAGILCAFPVSVNVSSSGSPTERVDAELVSGTYFSTLGVLPYLGRLVTRDDDRARLGHPVVVVSHSYWQSHLGADPAVVGRKIDINGAPYTVIGVSAPGFSGIEQGHPRSMFVPMKMKAAITPGWDGMDKPLIAWLWIVGRVKPQVDRDSLGRELSERLHAFQQPHLEADKRLTPSQREIIRRRTIYLEPLGDAVLDARVRDHLRMLGWVVGGLLLLTCANLAGLLLARGLERQRELATRLAIGASRWRLISQLLAESALLGLAGGFAGLLLGLILAPVLSVKFPLLGQGSRLDVSLDTRVLLFTLAVSIVASLAFGLVPAWQASRVDLVASLKGAAQGLRQRRFRQVLLAGQVSLALVLLVIAGLFATNLRHLLSFDVGFARNRLVIAELEPMLNGYDDDRRLSLYRRLDQRLAEEARSPGSGIVHAALSNVAPMSPWYWSSLFLIDGRRDEKDIIPRAVAVGPEYFETLRVPLRRGRLLTDRDDRGSPRVALISESLARRAFPESDPIGRRFTADLRKPEESTFEIVGIVADVDLNDPRRRNSRECVYLPYRQYPLVPQAIVIQVRLADGGGVPAAVANLRSIVHDLDPGLALYDVRTIETALDTVLVTERLVALLTGFFAMLAALLVAIGLYGIVSREVASRTREIGIRLALGASHRALLWSVVGHTMLFVGAGILTGGVILLGIEHRLTPLLVDVRPLEPFIMATAIAFLFAIAALGALLPGRTVTRVDPAVALRWE